MTLIAMNKLETTTVTNNCLKLQPKNSSASECLQIQMQHSYSNPKKKTV